MKTALQDKSREAVVFMAPAVRAGIGEFIGKAEYSNLAPKAVTALRRLGFAKVFDMSFSADITTIEEATEFLIRLRDGHPLPQFTSCCPGWVKIAETKYPQLLNHLSTTKSPQAIFGSLLKYFYKGSEGRMPVIASLVPCVLKKPESERPDLWINKGERDIDFVFTTKELTDLAADENIAIDECGPGAFDSFAPESGSGVIYGSTGGVASAIVRTVLSAAQGSFDSALLAPLRSQENIKRLSFTIKAAGPVPEILRDRFGSLDFLNGRTIKIAAVYSVPAIEKVVQDAAAGGEFAGYDLIEFMMCQGGCVGGAGQKRAENMAEAGTKRAGVLGAADMESTIKSPLSNPALLNFYRSYLPDGPGVKLAQQLVHKHTAE
ncbi:MAG: iron hydrogenase small subunit [Rickettsiales bacterium]|nr:iron hydrogenase small subunit [Rickettsiales bacterium]